MIKVSRVTKRTSMQELAALFSEAVKHATKAKDHLVNVELHQWKRDQKEAQIGPKSMQDKLAERLDQLDPVFVD